MTWVDKLERKYGRYAISNITRYLVFGVFIGYVLYYLGEFINIDIQSFLEFDAYKILHLQIWRLVTWVLCRPPSSSIFFCIIFLLCLIPMGRTLESFLGSFKMNLYVIGGILLSDIGGFLVYAGTYFGLGSGLSVYLSAYYILLTLFMALALCMPDAQVNLYFILPIRMKWMLLIYIVDLLYEIYTYFSYGLSLAKQGLGLGYGIGIAFYYSTEIIFALVNLIVFFLFIRNPVSRQQKKRQKEFRQQYGQQGGSRQGRSRQNAAGGAGATWNSNNTGRNPNAPRHKCVICGRTELDDPDLTFRFCSKCTGNKEYCQDHLFTHEHK